MRLPATIKIYFRCLFCLDYVEIRRRERPRRYCNRKCRDAAYYARKKNVV